MAKARKKTKARVKKTETPEVFVAHHPLLVGTMVLIGVLGVLLIMVMLWKV